MILKNHQLLSFAKIINYALWLLFIINLSYLIYNFPNIPVWNYGSVLKINGFTVLIWTLVTFFSALIGSYGKSYLEGFRYHTKFSMLCLGFTFSIMVFVMSNHVLLLLIMWLLMGVFMSKLIGVDATWGEAREASKFALKYFVAGSFFLSIGVLLLAYQVDSLTLSEIISKLSEVPQHITTISGLCIIIAALIQSAIYPFHRWLLSAMTAPTPASALMHAGFVNGSGILLTLFSTVLFASNTLIILFIIGGLTAVVAQFAKLLQVNVKQKLACSTIAQMGFMIMQCGLGFFNAAVVHLILHGFYKAYLFLSAGEEIALSKPQNLMTIKIKPSQAIIVLFYGIVGAFMFAFLTGKGTELNSGIFLILIVAITVGQATYNIVKEQSLSILQKSFLPPLLFVCGMVTYALIYKGVTLVMSDMPMAVVPLPLSVIQIAFGILFLAGFFIMKLGIYRKYPWLYVKLLNISQPYKKTVLMYKSKSI
ncbi:NAD(P)H-quinone oxidoreductase subunit 5 [Flavobacterium sp. CG_9.10]|uniref:proton-conducting transporter transmembrane domain-containing protein n=1 Tax=Flavobacterium sp. CG_9.10 TaxID=2787729 RepID=UPI0018C9F436|nr:proton-conducting transporter membrane subunit [Flavobacterium sp. CG_9.10]MBG6109312.1 NAD(P)H-quinone oxidoreductase subunit 5 [Flavobacterium sp. CG_9.10]